MLISIKMKLKPLNMLGKYALILAVRVTSLKHYYLATKRWVFLERPKHWWWCAASGNVKSLQLLPALCACLESGPAPVRCHERFFKICCCEEFISHHAALRVLQTLLLTCGLVLWKRVYERCRGWQL